MLQGHASVQAGTVRRSDDTVVGLQVGPHTPGDAEHGEVERNAAHWVAVTAALADVPQDFDGLYPVGVSDVLEAERPDHLFLRSQLRVCWGAPTARERGPLIAHSHRVGPNDARGRYVNVCGCHNGPARDWLGLSRARDQVDPAYKPTAELGSLPPPEKRIEPNPHWFNREGIVSFDPFGLTPELDFPDFVRRGIPVQPTIAMFEGEITLPEFKDAVFRGSLRIDNSVVRRDARGDIWVKVTKIVIEPAWYIPGIAARVGIDEVVLRNELAHIGDKRLLTRGLDGNFLYDVHLPPHMGTSVLIMGDPKRLKDPKAVITGRIHDECNGSDSTGFSICSCRPYLVHAAELAATTAQMGGVGFIVYNHKEARNLGMVNKYRVYNLRRQNPDGDRPENYFKATACVVGTEDARCQELATDVFRYLGIDHVDYWVSESNVKSAAVKSAGIEIQTSIRTPSVYIPADSLKVELVAKHDAGYGRGAVLAPKSFFGYDYSSLDGPANRTPMSLGYWWAKARGHINFWLNNPG
jgi:GTP cyclohydrolase II